MELEFEPKLSDSQVAMVPLFGKVVERKEPDSGPYPVTLGKSLSFGGTSLYSFRKEEIITKGAFSCHSVIAFPKSRSYHFSTIE